MARQQQLRHQDLEQQSAAVSAAPEGNALQMISDAANRLLDATDAALARALSNNSERFLIECRQQGGQ
jgi:hypothetical protein